MVRVTVSVGVRHYTEQLYIAQSLQSPFLSAAAASPDEALRKLSSGLSHVLEHLHPANLANLIQELSWEVEQRQLPLFRVQDSWGELLDDPSEAGLDDVTEPSLLGHAQVDVVWRQLSTDIHVIAAPTFGAVAQGATPEEAERALLTHLRSYQESAIAHRPPSDEFTLSTLELHITPLDLTRVPVDELWREQFPADLFEDSTPQDRPATPTLDDVGDRWSHLSQHDLDQRAFEPCFARGVRLMELEDLLSAHPPTPVVLVGPSRVGKTSLIKHLAVQRSLPALRASARSARRLWFASAPRLCATDVNSQGWQMQCRQLFAELEEADELLYIGRLVESLDAGKFVGSDYNLAQFMKPLLADHRLRVVAEATPEEWNIIEQRDIGFARTFHVIRMEDLPDDISFSDIVVPAAQRMAEREGITVDTDAILRAWLLQQRFASEGSTVGRTLDFLANVMRRATSSYQDTLTDLDLVRSFCEATGLPQFMLLDERTLDLDYVASQLEQRVMGQHQAVRRVADIIGITKAGLAPPDRPLGSFLFVGPTGVGKTELARALAEFLFGSEDRLVRLDMSEYSHPNAYGRLIGEDAMTRSIDASYSAGGDLTGPVRRQPFCVVLLDEIEKAHSSVFDLLLQVLGEARLTDVHGRTTRFQNTIVIMTSNLGVSSLKPSIGFGSGDEQVEWEKHFRREAERFFRPEFLARINQVIPFEALSQEVVQDIARRELAALQLRDGLSRLDVSFSCDEHVEAWLARHGWNPQYGARPLKRLIDREIAANLSRHLASTQNDLGPSQMRHIELTVQRDALHWSVEVIKSEDSEYASRRDLLTQIHTIAGLRRKLQQYTYTEVFADLEWEIENFAVTSMGEQFWQHPGAAEMAARAEMARRIVGPAETMAQELGALEDLAHEAYYGRAFELRDDLTERLDELRPQVRQIFLVILRSVFDTPDEVTLFLPLGRGADSWRNTLVRWYGKLANRLDLNVTAYHALPEHKLAHFDVEALLADPQIAYEKIGFNPEGFSSQSPVIALRFHGFAARPLLLGEDGLQRLIDHDGNAQVEVMLADEHGPWPLPDVVAQGRPSPVTARVWNRRTREVTVPYYASAPLNESDPWDELIVLMEDVAWMIVESRWEG